ncbi:MAG: hypothetical protein OHK0053_33460 [Microscillaceae bacterium]
MPTYHFLNGDCLAEQLGQTNISPAHCIICRECLAEGEVLAQNLTEFWKIRAHFIAGTYLGDVEEYFRISVAEFEKLQNLPPNAEVCIWFEHDLFCQVNLWFALSLLSEKPHLKIFRVFPMQENQADEWKGFGEANTAQLLQAYAARVPFLPPDLALGKNLWQAYQRKDLPALQSLSKQPSPCFQYLEEVCQAHIDRFPADNSLGRPEKALQEIMASQTKDFQEVFRVFSAREGIYGWSDLQVKRMYAQQKQAF